MQTEAAIQQVMTQTGMDRLQAHRHLQSKQELLRRPNLYPLGKNNSIDHDAEYAEWAKRHPDLAAAHV